MENLGDIPAGTTLYIPFNTYDAAGALVTASSLVAADLELYKNGSTTQRASDNGFTVTVDFDSTTGLHLLAIDLADNSDAGFYSEGAQYVLHVGPFTVDSQTVGLSYRFRLVPAESSAGVPKVDVSHFGGSAGTFSGGIPAVNATQISGSATAADNAEIVYATDFATNYDTTEDRWAVLTRKIYDNNEAVYVEPLMDAFGGGGFIVSGIGGSVGNDIATSVWSKDPADLAITTTHGNFAALVDGLENELAKVPKSDGTTTWNATALASINSQCDTALADYDGPTNAEMVARTLAAASYATSAAQTTAQNDLDILTGTDGVTLATSQPNYAPATSAQAVAIQGATFDTATDSLEALRNRGDAAWVTATGFSTLDAAGVRTAVGLSSANLDTQLAAIVADTNELQTNQGNWLTATGFSTHSAADVVTALGTGSGLTALATQSSVNTVAGYLDTEVAAILAAVDTEVAAIKAKTDNLPSDPADQSAVEAAILAAWTTALTESYNADGSAPTPAQALFLIMQRLTEFAISGTTITVKKLDGSTTAATLTLDDATNPTSSTRAS